MRLGISVIFQTISIVLFESQMKLIKYAGKRTIKRAKLDLALSESNRIQKSRTTHIRELTRFQHKISSDSAVHHGRIASPGVPHRENVWSPRDLSCTSQFIIQTAILSGLFLLWKNTRSRGGFLSKFRNKRWKFP